MTALPTSHYDICIIGGGPGGFAGAMRGVDLGKKVCLLEKAQLGGAGVMWGALASKTMWELAKDFHVASQTGRGYHAEKLKVDYAAMRKTVLAAVREKQTQMRTQLAVFSPAHSTSPGTITLKRGTGRFISSNQVAIIRRGQHSETITADYFLIATGSRPRHLSNIVVDQKQVLDSDGILRLKSFPKRLMIVGAGIVGCEYATIFSSFRRTQVTLLDHKDRILPFEDVDISRFVGDHLRQQGVEIRHSAKLERVRQMTDHLSVDIRLEDRSNQTVEVDALLLSVGRVPDLDGLGLESLGLVPDDKGFLPVDDNCLVKHNIYAAGDVTAHPALVNLAEAESRHAIKHMYGKNKWPLSYENMSTVMFFYPPVAAVGLNEKQCREKKIAYRVASYPISLVNRAIAMRSTDGFVKIIVSDDKRQKILGMRAAGPQASSTIMSVALLMDQDKAIGDVLKSLYPHPTMSEGIQECLRVLRNKSIYKPLAFPEEIKVRAWRP